MYVDDIIITGDDYYELEQLKGYLIGEFELNALGTLKYFMEMEVARSSFGIVVVKCPTLLKAQTCRIWV